MIRPEFWNQAFTGYKSIGLACPERFHYAGLNPANIYPEEPHHQLDDHDQLKEGIHTRGSYFKDASGKPGGLLSFALSYPIHALGTLRLLF